MNEKEKEKEIDKNDNNKDKDKNQKQLVITNIKDFEIIKELSISNEYIKIFKVLRKIDNKHYILLKYPLNIITNNFNNFQKLEKILEMIKILLKKINHDNILNIKESFIEKSKSSVIMILELYDNKTMNNNIISKYKVMKERYIPESTLLDYLYQIIEGLSILHNNNVFNINLSPQNIYIDDNNNLKLNPYISLESLSSVNKCNNNYFKIQAPELSKNSKNYTPKTDIWYLGLLIYEISQLKPIDMEFCDDYDNIYNYIIKCNYPFNNYYSNDIKELIKLCLQYSQNRRPSAVELLKIIDIYKKNKLLNNKLNKINKEKTNNLKKKINLKEEINKFNHTLAKIKNYEKRPKYKMHRDLTPIITRKNSNNNFNNNNTVLNHNTSKFFKRPKLRLKTCFINNNKFHIQKTGKKFFEIHKNNETLKGYLKTRPFDIKNFVSNNPYYFEYERNKSFNNYYNCFTKKQKSLIIRDNHEDISLWQEAKYRKLNEYIIKQNNPNNKNRNNNRNLKRANSVNVHKINKNNESKDKKIISKKKYVSPINKKNKHLSKSFNLPQRKK
jgi:NIMA (never in mitosis gene a)-related kinase